MTRSRLIVLGASLAALLRLAGARFERVSAITRRNGVLAVTASALGILPGTATATVLGDQLVGAFRSPQSLDLYLVAAALVVLVGATFAVRRWLFGRWTAY